LAGVESASGWSAPTTAATLVWLASSVTVAVSSSVALSPASSDPTVHVPFIGS
jgi:hypothetical protein